MVVEMTVKKEPSPDVSQNISEPTESGPSDQKQLLQYVDEDVPDLEVKEMPVEVDSNEINTRNVSIKITVSLILSDPTLLFRLSLILSHLAATAIHIQGSRKLTLRQNFPWLILGLWIRIS